MTRRAPAPAVGQRNRLADAARETSSVTGDFRYHGGHEGLTSNGPIGRGGEAEGEPVGATAMKIGWPRPAARAAVLFGLAGAPATPHADARNPPALAKAHFRRIPSTRAEVTSPDGRVSLEAG